MKDKKVIPVPLGNWILAVMIREDEVTEGGIHLVDRERKTLPFVEVVSKGPKAPDWLEIGTDIIIKNWGGSRLDMDKVTYVFLQESDIVAEVVEVEDDEDTDS